MEMKRMRRTRRETMADMESIRDLTRRDMDFQYLGGGQRGISFWVTLAYQLVSASISVWPLGCCLVITELNYI